MTSRPVPFYCRGMLEVCVDTVHGAMAAVEGGASRIELCASLSEGGLTPSAGLMRWAGTLPIPCYAMIRPRAGLFQFSPHEIEVMLSDIEVAKDAGLAGVMLGAQSSDGSLDLKLLQRMSDSAGGMGKTLHRVIDVVPEPLRALDQVIDLEFERVLTSGAKPTATEGVALIRQMVERANGRLSVMPGSGLTPESVAKVLNATGATEAHASCRVKAHGPASFSNFDPSGGRWETSRELVRQMVAAIGRA